MKFGRETLLVSIFLLLVIIPVEANNESNQTNPRLGPNDIPIEADLLTATSDVVKDSELKEEYSLTASTSEIGIDEDLKDMIDEYAPMYYRDTWEISLSEYKSWIALITLMETQSLRYGAHSGYFTDCFDHPVYSQKGYKFHFSTGVGAFQLTQGGEEGDEHWSTMPTIDKLDPEKSLKSTLRYHYNRYIDHETLSDFSQSRKWAAVAPDKDFSQTWEDITGYSWDECKNTKLDVNFNPPVVNDPYDNHVQYIGKIYWNQHNELFGKYLDTWLVKAGTYHYGGISYFDYYYTYDKATGWESWVLNDPEKKYIYRFDRNYSLTQYPENRLADGTAGVTDSSAAFDFGLDQSTTFGIPSSGKVTTLFFENIDYESSGSYYNESNILRSSTSKFHHGVDIAGGGTIAEDGTIENTQPVYSAGSGKVVYVGDDGQKTGYGNYVVIYHGYNVNGNGKYTYSFYSHMGNNATDESFVTASVGQQIPDGVLTVIGKQGNSGYTLGITGIHLDWEIRLSETELKDNPDGTWNTDRRYQTIAADPTFYTGVDLSFPEPYEEKVTASAPSGKKTSWEFDIPDNKEGWELYNIGSSSVTDGVFRIDPEPGDYWIESQQLAVNANNYNSIMINMASNAPDGFGAIYFKTSNSDSYTEDKKVEFSVDTDGKFRDYSIFMGENSNWKGIITGIRIDPSNSGTSDNKDIGFDFIRLTKISWEFNNPDDKEGWELYNIGSSSVTDGVFRIDPDLGDYWIESQQLAVNANNYNSILINMASNAPDGVGVVYFKTSDSNSYTEDKKVEFSVDTDGKFRDYSIYMGENSNWKGTITGIRIDPSNDGTSDNKDIGFDYIRFINSKPSLYTPLDLIFVIDTTGSMGDDIANVKASATEIVETLGSKSDDYRVAVVDYRDYPASPYGGSGDYVYNLDLPFSNDENEIVGAINSLNLGWGNDWRESVYSALVKAINDPNKDLSNQDNYGWRKGVTKCIILMGDAPPHVPEPWSGGYSLDDVIYWSENVDPVIVYSIRIGSDGTTLSSFSEISDSTGGKVYTAATASDLVDTILDVIEDIDPSGIEVNAGEDQEVAEGEFVEFSGSFTDHDSETHSIMWEFGDGGSASDSLIPTYAYGDDGTYTVTLTVTDENGNTGTDTLTVVVNNVGPCVDTGQDLEVTAGDLVSFSGTFSDPGWLDTHTAEWNFGEGTLEAGSVSEENEYPNSTGTASGSFSYFDAGDYTVTLNVTDDDSGIGQDQLTVTVLPIVATVDINPDTLNLGSGGEWVTAYIELPEGYDIAGINASTVLLNGTVSAVTDPKYEFVTNESEYIQDFDGDLILERMLKFDREEVESILEAGDEVTVTLSGKVEYDNGVSSGMASFEGSDVITVIEKKKDKTK